MLKKAEKLGVFLPFQDRIQPLFETIHLKEKKIPNRLLVQPMEGFDADINGSPSELTIRRYLRYASGGSGLIWFEATSVIPEGRSNPRQLMLTKENLDEFKSLVEQIRKKAFQEFGGSHEIFLILQITHSGRYSFPEGRPFPHVAAKNPYLDKNRGAVQIIEDEELGSLQDDYLNSAKLASDAGFDAVDLKACHGYLLNDMLAAHTRKNSRYGGNFENRTRFLLEICQTIHKEIPDLDLAVRLSVFDGIPFPYGFGMTQDGSLEVSLSEPKDLVRHLVRSGCTLFNITLGNPHYKPHYGRPYDRPLPSSSVPDEHPLVGISRLIKVTESFQNAFEDHVFVGTGYSWLRHFYPHVGAAALERGGTSLIGLGRSSFAYPDSPRDLMEKGELDKNKVCITCSRCSELMRGGGVCGCAVRDQQIYGQEYKKLMGEKAWSKV
jgi:2,4-dienoyl-CoA reductase-like NADH-dependent reductase (Old Yellow Enzyme family)